MNQKIKTRGDNSIFFWKTLTNLWTIITLFLYFIDFFSGNKIDSSTSAVGAIYIAILGIFTGTKEFERWQSKTYKSKYFGEIYIIIWTSLMIIFVLIPPFLNGLFKMPQEFIVTYIAVIGIFAVSHKSKQMYLKKSLKQMIFKK